MLLCGLSSRAADDLITQQITINVAEAGTLPAKIGSSKKNLITNLKLTGELNGSDFKLINDMATSSTGGHLSDLDIENVKIVGGYFGAWHYENDALGTWFFRGCNCLTNLKLPKGIVSIGFCTFDGCTNLKNLSIPSSVTSIDVEAFQYCTNLESISIPMGVTTIASKTFQGCSSLKKVDIPSSVNKIEDNAFINCTSLEDLVIPENVTVIKYHTFDGCSSLKTLNLPKNLTIIEHDAFLKCTALSEISIPVSVTSIEDYAFYGCSGLSKVYVHWTTPIETGKDVFKGCDSENGTLYVPKGTYQDYWLSEFAYFKNIVEYDATGINPVSTSVNAKPLSRYSVNGQRLTSPAKGLNFVKYSDGSVRKEIVK